MMLIMVLGFGIQITLEYQNRKFSAKYFSFLAYDDSIESRKWLDFGEGLSCTYAVVSLSESSPVEPPTEWLNELDWYRTPVVFEEAAKTRHCYNLICECRQDWSKETTNRLDRVISSPGSFYYFHKHGPPHRAMGQGVMYIYSNPEKVAAQVRFGD